MGTGAGPSLTVRRINLPLFSGIGLVQKAVVPPKKFRSLLMLKLTLVVIALALAAGIALGQAPTLRIVQPDGPKRQLAHERLNPKARWRRVALQPAVNLDFFSRLYRQMQPEFASFHTNHVAH